MRTLYFECNMGAAGDMLTAALLELHSDPVGFIQRLNGLGLPRVHFKAERVEKCGILGTHMAVTVDGVDEEGFAAAHDHDHDHEHSHDHSHDHKHHHHEHHGLYEIEHLVSHLLLPDAVKADVLAVYRIIAEAESHAHGKPVEEIHFHEVGTLDAVADIVAVCLLIHELAPERIAASAVHVGSGHVHCAHGILPVPAPATAWILRDVPTYGGRVKGELCTPTGAALLKHFVQEFGDQPAMRVERIGYGCGTRNFEYANCVRAMLGETSGSTDGIVELRCNLDDMTPEAIAFAMERLFDAGALDVYTMPIGMKKNRPGVLLSCICHRELRDEMLRLIFMHTTTLGIRETEFIRHTLDRKLRKVRTEYGDVRIKCASGWGVQREKPEYEDLAAMAREHSISLAAAEAAVRDRFED